ncbi:hypothetical protein Pcinc_000346 [Petrolisthes cinctipes]|uniref:Uncharacterized protein n=1 Tax=Petrolisthes cinctipes TaxID=88211 RepID=A0AAE1GNR2_PETCI|nr:hypothetical protein Pcinc_000346 [Petrolisthes cinctipes]
MTEFINWSTSSNPQDTHHNYFSLANVAQKYKRQLGLKSVKRGVCVCIHEIRPGMDATQSVPLALHSLHKPVLFLHLRLW